MANVLPPDDDQINLKKYLFLILANWYWFVFSVFLGIGGSWLVNRYTMPMYKVTGSLMLSENSSRGLTGYENLIPGMEIYRTQKLVLNELEVLKSYSLAARTIEKLDFGITYVGVGRSGIKEAWLYNNSPFYVVPDSTKFNLQNYKVGIEILSNTHYNLKIDDGKGVDQKMAFGEKFENNDFHFTIYLKNPEAFAEKGGYNTYYFILNNPVTLANFYRYSLGIASNDDRRGSVLFLSLSGHNPQQITSYLNALMQEYITKGLEEKNQTAINTVNFIDEQLAVLDTSLKQAEMSLQDFRLQNKLIDLSLEGNAAFTRLETLLKEKSLLDLQLRYFDYLKKYITDRNNLNQVVVPATFDINDPLLGQLISQLNILLTEKAELSYTAKESSPSMGVIETKIESVRLALFDNIESLLQSNAITRQALDRQIAENEKALEKFPVTERLLISIQRQYKVNDQIYTYLLQKRAESAIAKAANVSDNKILDPARPESVTLISPSSRKNNMLGLAIGIFLPFAILLLIDLTNNKITSRSDIERKTSIPIISAIGHNATGGDIPVFDNPRSAFAESFRGLRTNLQYMLRDNDHKIIAITSTISGEGKTFSSTNLAAIFAMSGKKVLIMGLDLRRPKIHKIFNLNNTTGLSNCLIGQAKLADIVQPTPVANLFVAPSGPVPPNPAELLEGSVLGEIFRQAREEYDLIIADTPPFGMVTDSLLIAKHADLNLFILRQNYSTKDILELMEDLYQQKSIGPMGIIMNDIKKKGYYGYGYRYYNYDYSYRYGYYYQYGNYEQA
jgi:capsular exopolysaccharide synthesis family protein